MMEKKQVIDFVKILPVLLIAAVLFVFNQIFLANVLLLLGVFVFSYMNLFFYDNYKFRGNYNLFIIITFFVIMYFLIFGALEISYKTLEAYHYMAFFVASVLAFFASFLLKKTKHNFFRVIFKAFIVSLFLEIFVFNFNSFKINYEEYEENIKVSNVAFSNFDAENMKTENDGESVIEVLGIDEKVGTLYFKANSKDNKKIKINIDFADDTRREYRNNIASGEIVNDCEKSFFIPINASGNVSKMRIKINHENGDVVTVEEFEFNKVIPFNFSFVRILFILGIVFFKYLFCNSERFSKTFEENERLCVLSARGFTVFLIAFAFLMIIVQRNDLFSNIIDDFKMESGNQITKELVDAFENGSASLLTEVPDEIEALDNPYDGSQREGISYLWDHLYFDGNYYSYYGIAPVLVLCLPFHLITGYYFPSLWCTFLFGVIGIFFLYKLYMAFMKEFFGDMKISFVLMGLAMIQFASGIWFCFATGNFYEIAQASGFAFVTAGSYFMIISGCIGKRKINLINLAVSTVLFAFGVLARPTLAVYCVCSLIFIFAGFIKKRKTFMSKNIKGAKYYIGYFAAALLPFAIIGGIQMIYNYARFGNIMDFGIQYSLTINDFTNTEFHSHFAGIGFYNYLFAVPNIIPEFPFISSHVETFNPNGYYFVATNNAIGLFVMALPCFSYFYGKKAYMALSGDNKRLYLIMLLSVCIIAPFVIIASVWESGYGARYKVDFAWQFLLGAFTIAFIIYRYCENESVKKIMTKAFFCSVVLCFILSFTQMYSYTLNASGFNHADIDKYLCAFEKAFEFWR